MKKEYEHVVREEERRALHERWTGQTGMTPRSVSMRGMMKKHLKEVREATITSKLALCILTGGFVSPARMAEMEELKRVDRPMGACLGADNRGLRRIKTTCLATP